VENPVSSDDPPGPVFFIDMALHGLNYFYVFSFSAIIFLLLVSAMVSASEVAFFSLKPEDLSHFKETDEPNNRRIVQLLKEPRRLLATILVIHDFVNVGIVTIATFVMWRMAGTNRPAELIVGLVTFGATFAITFFAEIIPKVYATQNNLAIARVVSGTWVALGKICTPITWPLMNLTSLVESRVKRKGYDTTVEELNQALDLTTDNDGTTEEEKDILKGIVNFGLLTVKQAMKSRMEISAVNIELGFPELMEKVRTSGFSRIPVYRESLDNIEGILYIKDLLPFLEEDEKFEWQKLLRPGYFVPETKKLDSLLKDFQSKRVHMALVVDEYGGTAGLITLEDLIEEIIGEINDEFDEVNLGYQKIDDKTYLFEGKTSLHDLCKVLEVDPAVFDEVRGESESLGGLILELHGAMPTVDEKISYDRFVFTIVSVDQKKIKRVRVTLSENVTAHE
jgi:gliding motility-associated protein GldE